MPEDDIQKWMQTRENIVTRLKKLNLHSIATDRDK